MVYFYLVTILSKKIAIERLIVLSNSCELGFLHVRIKCRATNAFQCIYIYLFYIRAVIIYVHLQLLCFAYLIIMATLGCFSRGFSQNRILHYICRYIVLCAVRRKWKNVTAFAFIFFLNAYTNIPNLLL